MERPVVINVKDGVAILEISNPPVNVLGAKVRRGLADAISAAQSNPEISAIVIAASGTTFPAGADISELDQPQIEPGLPDLFNQIELATIPVVAAIHGTAFGGGLELALCSHYRVAQNSAKLGLPEVKLGILPGAGGTQRLPRLVGAEKALDLMLSGEPISAEQAHEWGVVDELVEGPVVDRAVKSARKLIGKPIRRTRDQRDGFGDGVAYAREVAVSRTDLTGTRLIAPFRIVDCVEAAQLLPFEAGMAFEAAAFEDCRISDQAAALRHMFFAERTALKPMGNSNTTARNVLRIGIDGTSELCASLATAALGAGIDVSVVADDDRTLEQHLAAIGQQFDSNIDAGKISRADADRHISRLTAGIGPDELCKADLVFETSSIGAGSTGDNLRQISSILKKDAVLVTTVTTDAVSDLALKVSNSPNFLAVRLQHNSQSPAVLEINSCNSTTPQTVATCLATLKRMGQLAVVAGRAEQTIGQALQDDALYAAEALMDQGASPFRIDTAMRAWGFSAGPFQLADQSGLDLRFGHRGAVRSTGRAGFESLAMTSRLREMGRAGRQSGAGYYLYRDGQSKGEHDPEILSLLDLERRAKGIKPKTFSTEEIQAFIGAALVNAGAHLLLQGVAQRSSDIDVIAVLNGGFPRWRGGPMKSADMVGLLNVQKLLQQWADESGNDHWYPAPLFKELIKNGRNFSS